MLAHRQASTARRVLAAKHIVNSVGTSSDRNGGGALSLLGLWIFAFVDPSSIGALSQSRFGTLLLGVALLVPPAFATYGLLLVVAPERELSGDTSRFGGMLVEQQAQARWKKRMLAIAAGIVHFVLFGAFTG